MARNLLTAIEIKNSTKAKLRDGDGLWLHTGKSGSRHWVFIFIRQGRRREMGLGAFGSGTGNVSLASARMKAEEIRGILGRGADPFKEMEERKAIPKAVTFGEAVDEYIEAMKSKWRGARTENSWRRFAKEDAKSLRRISVADITTDDILRCVRPIWHEKAETASKARERIKLVLDQAKVRGLRTGDNPALWKGYLDQLLPAPEKLQRGHHAAMPYKDVPAFMTKVQAAGGMGARALEFTILTATRSGEARNAVWSEFDLEEQVWTIPASRMKESKEHRVPLTDRAVEIVKAMQERRISDLVFPGQSPRRPISDMTMAKVLKTLKVAEFTVHGFRSSFRDWTHEETSHPREIAEAALAHAVGDHVERAYRRGDALVKRRALMSDWAAYCTTRAA